MVSSRRIMADLRLFGRGYLRNRVGLFFGLIFPVILISIFGLIFAGGSTGPTPVYVQNLDKGAILPQFNSTQFISTPFILALNTTGTIRVTLVSSSENFTSYLAAHSSSDGIIIPPDFSANYTTAKPVNVTVYGNPSTSTSAIVSGTVNGVNNYFNLQLFKGSEIVGISQSTVNSHVYKYIDFLVPGLIGFGVLINPMFSLVNISSEYKKSKLFKQLSLTPITKLEWLTAKVLWYIFLSTLSFLLMVAVGIFAFGAHIALTVWLIPFLVLGPMLFVSLGMLVGTVSKSVETAAVVGNVVTFPMMFLSGTFFPVSAFPSYLQTIAHILPLFYVIDGLNAVMVYGNIPTALVDIGVTGLITAIIFIAAARLFKWRED
jgi:ABC-2 type transport system permease protein